MEGLVGRFLKRVGVGVVEVEGEVENGEKYKGENNEG